MFKDTLRDVSPFIFPSTNYNFFFNCYLKFRIKKLVFQKKKNIYNKNLELELKNIFLKKFRDIFLPHNIISPFPHLQESTSFEIFEFVINLQVASMT